MEKFASGQPAENFARQRGNFSHFSKDTIYIGRFAMCTCPPTKRWNKRRRSI